MYCEECGAEMQITDKFCEKCGNKNRSIASEEREKDTNNTSTGGATSSTINTPLSGVNTPKFSIKKLAIPALIIGLIFIVFTLFGGDSISTVNNKYIDHVKNASPVRYPNATYGEAFDNYIGDINWEHFTSDSNKEIVEITGNITYDGSKVKVLIQYEVNSDDTIAFSYYEIIDRNIDISENSILLYLYDNAFKEVYVANGYELPSDISVELYGYKLAYGLIDAFSIDSYISGSYTSDNQITGQMFNDFFSPITKSNTSVSNSLTSTTVAAETKPTADLAIEETKGYEEAWGIKGDGYYDDREEEMDSEVAMYVTTENAGLYSDMNTSNSIMTIPAGMNVGITDDCGNGWHYAIYNNKDGFIESSKIMPFNDYHNRETAAEVAIGNGQYILPESSARAITDAELSALTSEQLRLAINEIYARHGRRFNDSELQTWFDSKDWYNGTIASENFSESVLSQIEKNNISKLSAARNNKGFTPDWIYGTYENDIATAEIGWYSGDDADYIYLQGSYGMYAGEFSGVVISNANNFYVAQDEDGYVLSFEYNGIDRIEVFDDNHNYGMGFPGFTGTYKKIKDLSQYVS